MKNNLEDVALFLLHALVSNIDTDSVPDESFLPKLRAATVEEAFLMAKEFQRQSGLIEKENDN